MTLTEDRQCPVHKRHGRLEIYAVGFCGETDEKRGVCAALSRIRTKTGWRAYTLRTRTNTLLGDGDGLTGLTRGRALGGSVLKLLHCVHTVAGGWVLFISAGGLRFEDAASTVTDRWAARCGKILFRGRNGGLFSLSMCCNGAWGLVEEPTLGAEEYGPLFRTGVTGISLHYASEGLEDNQGGRQGFGGRSPERGIRTTTGTTFII